MLSGLLGKIVSFAVSKFFNLFVGLVTNYFEKKKDHGLIDKGVKNENREEAAGNFNDGFRN